MAQRGGLKAKRDGTPIPGALPLPSSVCRTPISTGAIALLPAREGQHGAYLAVATTHSHEAIPQVPRNEATTASALQLPADLLAALGAAAVPEVESSPCAAPSLRVRLYAVSGLECDEERMSCLHLHTIPLTFTSPSAAGEGRGEKTDRSSQRDAADAVNPALTVEKMLWAGPSLLAVMNELGEVLVCRTGLAAARSSVLSSDDSSSDDGDCAILGSHTTGSTGQQALIGRYTRIVDMAAAETATTPTPTAAEGSSAAVVLLAGLRGLRALVVAMDSRGRITGTTTHSWSLGPFRSVAVLPCSGSQMATPQGGADSAQLLLAGCTNAGVAQVFHWRPLQRSRSDPSGTLTEEGTTPPPPTPMRQVLIGQHAQFLGIAAGRVNDAGAFALLGVGTATGPAGDGGGDSAPATDGGLPTAMSLRGKDGKRLLVGDFFTAKEVALFGRERDPLNQVIASLRAKEGEKRTDEHVGEAFPSPARTLDDITPAVLVAPPSLALSTRQSGPAGSHPQAEKEVFLLLLTVSDGGRGGACAAQFRRVEEGALLRDIRDPGRMLPTLHGVTREDGAQVLEVLLHSREQCIALSTAVAVQGATDTSKAVCSAQLSVGGESRALAGVDHCPRGRCNGPSNSRLVLLDGVVVASGNAGEGDDTPAADGGSSRTRRRGGLTELQCRVATMEETAPPPSSAPAQAVATGAALPINVGSLVHGNGGMSADALREMIRQVVREEQVAAVRSLESRLASVEAKLDQLLSRLT